MTEKKTSKRGKKGGTKYPRIPLKKVVEYAESLVSKTHTGPQPREIVGPGVFGTATTAANERISALRQYGLLKGNDKGFDATQFARELTAAPDEERQGMLQRAFLKPSLFKKLFDTFVNDTVTKAKVRQQALLFKVHPDVADSCTKVFLESAAFAGMCNVNGDNATFLSFNAQINQSSEASTEEDSDELSGGDEDERSSENDEEIVEEHEQIGGSNSKSRANLEIKIDPSMDPEKLEKLLGVLKKFGQI